MKPKVAPKVKKDFQKIKHKVGQRKAARNETEPNSVTTKRVVVPLQKFDSEDIISDALIGLRHYSDKKRIDSVNVLARLGASSIPTGRLSEVINHLGYCISDDDAAMRKKCSTLLCRVLAEIEDEMIGPFLGGIMLHVRAALANVKPSIRVDAIACLKTLLGQVKIADDSEVLSLLRALIDLNSTILTSELVKRATGRTDKASSGDFRCMLWECVEELLENLHCNQTRIEEGVIDSCEWTLGSILARNITRKSLTEVMDKFLRSLERTDEEGYHERIEAAAFACGLTLQVSSKPSISVARAEGGKKRPQKTKSAFSQLSALMNSDSE